MKSLSFFLLFFLMLNPLQLWSQAATIDESFGETIESWYAKVPCEIVMDDGKICIQSDGKMLVSFISADDILLYRFNPDGSLDQSYGNNGTMTIDPSKDISTLNMLTFKNDEMVILTTYREENQTYLLFIRFDRNGDPIASFGESGMVSYGPFQEDGWGFEFILGDNETFIVKGSYRGHYIMRFLRDGSVDRSFGDNGMCKPEFDDYNSSASGGIALDRKGNILLATWDHPNRRHCLIKIKNTGVIDDSFGDHGCTYLEEDMSLTPGIKIVVTDENHYILAGYNYIDEEYTISKFDEDGNLESAFGTNGTVRLETETHYMHYFNLGQDSNGNLYLKGSNVVNHTVYTYKIKANGAIDDHYGVSGLFSMSTAYDQRSSELLVNQDASLIIPINTTQPFLIKVSENGQLDKSFAYESHSGYALHPESCLPADHHIAHQSNNQIIQAYFNNSTEQYNLIRYNQDETSFDADFGYNGRAAVDMDVNPEGGCHLFTWGAGRVQKIYFSAYSNEQAQYFYLPISLTGVSEEPVYSGIQDDPAGGIMTIKQGDGKMLLSAFSSTENCFYLARYLTSGELDTDFSVSFGDGGIRYTGLMDEKESGAQIALQSDGKILLAARKGFPDNQIYVMRFHSDGSVDETFGADGLVLTQIQGTAGKNHVLKVQDDGKILVLGYNSSEKEYQTVRLLTGGSFDSDFGKSGVAISPDVTGYPDAKCALVVQDDGKIIISACQAYYNSYYQVRYLPNGRLDPDFANGGIYISDLSILPSGGNSIWIKDDHLLQIGYLGPPENKYFRVKYFLDGGNYINHFESQGDFSIYPNPATDHVWIEMDNMTEDLIINLFDLSGRKIMSQQRKDCSQFKLTMGYPAGIYLLELSTPGKLLGRKKIILQH